MIVYDQITFFYDCCFQHFLFFWGVGGEAKTQKKTGKNSKHGPDTKKKEKIAKINIFHDTEVRPVVVYFRMPGIRW